MKTKSFWIGVVALMCAVLMTSCSSSVLTPKECQVEIDDTFSAMVSVAVVYMVYDGQISDAFADELEETAEQVQQESNEKGVAKFRIALEQMAQDDAFAQACLELYSSIEPEFSEWEQQPDQDGFSVWTATETQSDIKTTFLNNKDFEWSVNLDNESFTAFIAMIADSITE